MALTVNLARKTTDKPIDVPNHCGLQGAYSCSPPCN